MTSLPVGRRLHGPFLIPSAVYVVVSWGLSQDLSQLIPHGIPFSQSPFHPPPAWAPLGTRSQELEGLTAQHSLSLSMCLVNGMNIAWEMAWSLLNFVHTWALKGTSGLQSLSALSGKLQLLKHRGPETMIRSGFGLQPQWKTTALQMYRLKT